MIDKEFVKGLDYSGITFPVQIRDIKKIEKGNYININVFGYDNGRIYPIRVSKKKFMIILNYYTLKKKERVIMYILKISTD